MYYLNISGERRKNMKLRLYAKWKVYAVYEYWIGPECDSIYYSYASARKRIKELREDYPDIKALWIEEI